IDWIERIALSTGLSIAIVPLLGLLLNFTPWGIRFTPVLAIIVAFTLLLGLAAYLRRMQLPPNHRLSATLELTLFGWRRQTVLVRILTLGLGVSVIVASATLAYIASTPRPAERFTEFFLLGPGGNP